MLTTAVHAEVPTDTLRSMIYAYPTFHRAIEIGAGRTGREHEPTGAQRVVRRAARLGDRRVVRGEVDLPRPPRLEARRARDRVVPVRRPDAVAVARPGRPVQHPVGEAMPSQSHSQRRYASGSRRKSPASITGVSSGSTSSSRRCWSSPMSSGSQASRERT